METRYFLGKPFARLTLELKVWQETGFNIKLPVIQTHSLDETWSFNSSEDMSSVFILYWLEWLVDFDCIDHRDRAAEGAEFY